MTVRTPSTPGSTVRTRLTLADVEVGAGLRAALRSPRPPSSTP